MNELNSKRIAVIATDGFEESELTEPVKALREAGATVEILSLKREPIQGFKHHQPSTKVDVDKTLDEVDASGYDGVVLPGGALNADALRTENSAQRFVQAINGEGKPMAVICHAPWLLVSAGLARGRRLTSWPTIADDLRNAGADWVDSEVVTDQNLITSRGPQDIAAFNRATIDLLSRSPQAV